MSPTGALARLATRLTRRSGIVWVLLLAVTAAVVVAGYEATYPHLAQRLLFAAEVRTNLGFQALYGRAFDLSTTGGFAAWRIGGLVSVIVMLWGASSAVRLTRAEEQAGRGDLVGAGAVTRLGWYVTLAGVAGAWQLLGGLGLWVMLVIMGLAPAGSAVLAAEIALSGLVGVGVGLLAAQIWPTRARAVGRASLLVGALFLVRVLADGTTHLRRLRWVTPFGWGEESRPFAQGQRLAPLALLGVLAMVAAVAGGVLVSRRDVGGAFRSDDDRGPATTTWLRGLAALELKVSAAGALGWAAAFAVAGAVSGMLASSVTAFARQSPEYRRVAIELGLGDPGRPAAFVGLMFTMIGVAVAVYAARAAAAGAEAETDGLLDNLAARPLTRRRWLLTHVAVAAVFALLATVAGGLGAWLGGIVSGGAVTVLDAVGAGLNLVPLAVLVLGIGALVHALSPRPVAAVTLGVVVVGYVLELLGSLLRAPGWVRDLSPFHHLSAFPATAIRPTALAVLTLVGAAAALVGGSLIDRRDVRIR